MSCKTVFLSALKALAITLLLINSGIASAATRTIESGKWQLMSLPGNYAAGPLGALLGSTLLSDSYRIYSYDTSSAAYQRLTSEDQLVTSEAFWFVQLTGQPITIDLSLIVSPPEVQFSEYCTSSNGCFEHDLSGPNAVNWTQVGAPFAESVAINELIIVTNSIICAQGCTIAQATDAGLTNGIFYGYDADAASRYVSRTEGDSLLPESGYWFYTVMPEELSGATLLIPNPVDNVVEEEEPVTEPAPEPTPEPATDDDPLFSSGFSEGTTLAGESRGYQRLEGTDSVTGFRWDETLDELWGSSNNGIHIIDGGGNSGGILNQLQNVVGPTGEDTTALYQEIAFSSGSPRAQTPYQINNITEDPDEYYISYWIKIDDTSLDEDDQWRIVWQYKTDHFDYQDPEPGYRIGIYIYTDENGPYWHVKGDDQDPDYWSVSDRETPVPRDEWFRVEVYSKVSSGDDGRFWARINGTEIASHDGPNLGSADDTMKFMMLWQMYGNSYPAHQWIDDVEIWDRYPYSDGN